VFIPCDAIEARKATLAAAHIWGPVYLRFQREATPIITTDETPYMPGKAQIFWDSSASKVKPKVLIIACGGLLYDALCAARKLEEDGIGSIVLNCHSIKPLDERKIIELAKKMGAVVTVEEHQIIGGLGSAIAELLARNAPTPIEFIGMHDVFGESGQPVELLKKYGMDAKSIMSAVKKVLRRKKQ